MNKPGGKGNVEFPQKEKEQVQWALRLAFGSFMKQGKLSLSEKISFQIHVERSMKIEFPLDKCPTEHVQLLYCIYFFFLVNILQENGICYKKISFEYELSKEVFRDMFGECVRKLIDSDIHLSVFPPIGSYQTTIEEYHTWLRDVFDIDMTQQVVATTEIATKELLGA